ncbi:hypothetical protein pb186bvf_021070 [Paramecium bursaria]
MLNYEIEYQQFGQVKVIIILLPIMIIQQAKISWVCFVWGFIRRINVKVEFNYFGNNEFSYPAFNGMIADVRGLFGKGFVGNTKLISQTQFVFTSKKQILILQAQRDFLKDDTKPPVQGSYDQYAGVLEYAVQGQLMSKRSGSVDQLQTIFRFTINPPEIMKNKQNSGDRTLAWFSQGIQNWLKWSRLDIYILWIQLEIEEKDNVQFNDLKHFVINKFWVYIAGCDKITPGFEGTLYNWNVHLEGSFTNKPKQLIEVWPYEPKDRAALTRRKTIVRSRNEEYIDQISVNNFWDLSCEQNPMDFYFVLCEIFFLKKGSKLHNPMQEQQQKFVSHSALIILIFSDQISNMPYNQTNYWRT